MEWNTLLVVDDNPTNLDVIRGVLKDTYRLKMARHGKKALEIARSSPPDLILLDIMMPEMDGYEIFQSLKEYPETREIPVIFLTAKTGVMDEARGLELGAVDYITKPIQPLLLAKRVKTHLQMHLQKRELQQAYAKLQELSEVRDGLTKMVVHDLNNPLVGIMGYADLMLISLQGGIRDGDQLIKDLNTIKDLSLQMGNLIGSILDLSKLEAGKMTLHLGELDMVKHASLLCQQMAPKTYGKRELSFESSLEDGLVMVDEPLFSRIVQNLISNALKYTPKETEVTCSVTEKGEELILSVSDQGEGIPEDYRERIFDKFFQIEAKKNGQRVGVGLGLAFCKMAVSAMDGRIWVEAGREGGAVFRVAFKKCH